MAPRKFLPKKAIELGCKPGLHFKILAAGSDVTLDNGTIVSHNDVMEQALPSESFIVNIIPDESYIESVINNEKYDAYFSENITDLNHRMAFVYHSVQSKKVLENEDYLSFMNRFGPDTKHIIDCRDINEEVITRINAYKLTQRYNIACSRLFPIHDVMLKSHLEDKKELF